MASDPPVSVVVLSWHGRADTLACVRALRALTYSNWSLILIDNEGCDFTAEEARDLAAGAQYERTDVNLGFAGGSNLGMRRALAAGAEYVWFLNNDAEPEPEALSELVAVARANAAIGVVGAKILQQAEPERLDSVALDLDLRWGRVYLRGHDEVDRGQYDDVGEAPAVSGCALLLSRPACERLGGFDERYFAYLEDADLCCRARAAGFRVAVAPRARVRHRRAAATRGRQSVTSLYYTTRNHFLLMDAHGTGGGWQRQLRRAVIAALTLAYALRDGNGSRADRLRAVRRGLHDYRRGVVGALANDSGSQIAP
jgi:GT2 family glycosyltransferase